MLSYVLIDFEIMSKRKGIQFNLEFRIRSTKMTTEVFKNTIFYFLISIWVNPVLKIYRSTDSYNFIKLQKV